MSNTNIANNVTTNNKQGKVAQKKYKPITYVETCAGYGTTRMALNNVAKRLGLVFKCIAISEKDDKKVRAYEQIHGKVENLGDFTKIDWSQLIFLFLSLTFPCKSVSKANVSMQKGFEEGANQKSSIVWKIRNLFAQMPVKPKMIFFENVDSLLNKKNKSTFDKLVSYLESEGYFVNYKTLKASDYGVPQTRNRVYIFATYGFPVDFDWPEPKPLEFEFRDILDEDYTPDRIITDKAKDGFIKRAIERGFAFRVHNPKATRTAFTITCSDGGRNSDNFLFVEDVSEDEHISLGKDGKITGNVDLETISKSKIRKITSKEALRLMGIPEEYWTAFFDNFSQRQIVEMLGDGIVLPVLEEILYQYFKKLMEDGRLELED